jgi:predicted HD phosphohydrolase
MSPIATARFAEHRWFRDALALRRWDDQAKVKGRPTQSLAEWALAIRRYFR